MTSVQRKYMGIDFTRLDTNQEHELGLRLETNDGKCFRYYHAGAAIALGDVLIDDFAEGTWEAQPSSAVDQVPIGCWPNENVSATGIRVAIADNLYFWAQVGGDALVKAAATVVVAAPGGTTATAGTVDDVAAAVGNALAAASGAGLRFVTVTSGGFARVMFNG